MENKKTISYLNGKAWYRLLKVFYIIIFLISCTISLFINFDSVGSYQNDYLVVCNYGNKSTFLAYKDKNIYIYQHDDYSDSLAKLSDNTKEELRSACGISQEEQTAKIDRIFKGTDDGKKFFDLNKTKVITYTYLTAFLWSALAIAIIFIVLEIIRRAFYYIVLGKIRPEK